MSDQQLIDSAFDKAKTILNVEAGEVNKLQFITLYVALSDRVGDDKENMQHWMHTHNKHLGYCPAEHLEFMDEMIEYLETL